MKTSPPGNAALVVSLQNCFAQNVVMKLCKAAFIGCVFQFMNLLPPPDVGRATLISPPR